MKAYSPTNEMDVPLYFYINIQIVAEYLMIQDLQCFGNVSEFLWLSLFYNCRKNIVLHKCIALKMTEIS